MTVSNSWQALLVHVTEFVANHPEIRIDENIVSIPEGVRGEFYQLFDAVTDSFVQQQYVTLPTEAAALVDQYVRVESEVYALLGVQGVSMPTRLDLFLHHPGQGLAQALFDELFELLQGKVDRAAFERRAVRKLDSTVSDLCRWGYPLWVSLSLIKLLEPDASFQVAFDVNERPILQKLESIPFGHQARHHNLRVPELVVHSRRFDKYVAFKLDSAGEISAYAPENPFERKQSFQRGGQSWPVLGQRVLLLYVMTGPEDIPVVAQVSERQVTSPDLVAEFQWQEGVAWDEVEVRREILQPSRGTFLIANKLMPDPSLEMPRKGIEHVEVGLDQGKLQFLVARLADENDLNRKETA
jgi:hypothetical protein